MTDRKQVENRIVYIISNIDKEKTLSPLIWSIKLFSYEELLQLLEFLESWDYKPIYLLLDKKINEYIWIIEEIKQLKIWKKVKNFKEKEKLEKQKEEEILENMLTF